MPAETTHLRFRKSSYSSAKGQDCVEVADTTAGAAVRDTQNRHLGHIEFGGTEWRAFIQAMKNNEV
ncbi:DUF397 domain-containing protein [Nocardiopsis composta]|uniref:DUF397 domain-containing protein n=1 Tax=Nocardiopsis composta TaxID=157465 RepID=A0A7W8VF05_9ACTN|nr:DUF397 domain-containing protein [Nocardiopsis composta]MBB5433628.1 hypothetical protein [Nocardiopsis composta]